MSAATALRVVGAAVAALALGAAGAPRATDDHDPAMRAFGSLPSGGLADADRRFIVAATVDGLFELEASRLAAARAASPQVRALATLWVDDHVAAHVELAELALVRGVAAPAGLPRELQAQLRALLQASARRFERDYLRTVGVAAHERSIRSFERAAHETRDAILKAWIERMLPVLRQHLSAAQKAAAGA